MIVVLKQAVESPGSGLQLLSLESHLCKSSSRTLDNLAVLLKTLYSHL